MNEVAEHSFRTRAGICTITPERIILERHGIRRAVSNLIYGNTIQRAIIIYGLITAAALGVGAWALARESYVAGGLLCFVGLCFLRNVILSRNTSAATVIERSSIQSVEAHPPRPLLTRGYFTVWFSEKGKKRRRYIMLPGFMSNGNNEYPRALLAMQEAGLLNGKKE
jgi:hypothetical protein